MKRLRYESQIYRAILMVLAICVVPFSAGAALPAQNPAAVAQLSAEVREKGWIAYSARSPKGDWDIHLCRPDGSDAHPLTQSPKFSEFSPLFSRDGRKLLYRRMSPGEKLDDNRHGEQGELVMVNIESNEAVVLGKAGELPWASFNPDGTLIASLSIKGVSIYNIARREVVRTIPRKGFFQQMTWSPDGKWLCGVANAFGASWSIARMHVETGEASAVNRVDCCTPDWFPSSQEIIFSWRPPGQKANKGYGWTQLWRATADGTQRQLVYGEEGRHVYGGHVSPDGNYVLFTGNMQEDGDPGRAGAPMALMRLRDGPAIAGESRELRTLHPVVNDAPVLVLPTGWEPCWTESELPGLLNPSPTTISNSMAQMRTTLKAMGWLAFSARSSEGDWDLFACRPDGSGRRPLTQTTKFNEAGVRFSPSGDKILYYRMPKTESVDNNTYGTFNLIIADADGRNPIDWGKGFQWASWGPDGKKIACLGAKGIQIVDVENRQVVREMPKRGIVSQLIWSPDGKKLTGTANGLGQYWNIGCLTLDNGILIPVSETNRYNCTSDWMPDSKRIVYSRGIIPEQLGWAEAWMSDVDRDNKQRIYAEAGVHVYGACSSPDGKYFLFTRSTGDLGRVAEIGMSILQLTGDQPILNNGMKMRVDIGPGWEPHWTMKEILK